MEAASTSKPSENFYQSTRRNNPEDSHLQTPYSFLTAPISTAFFALPYSYNFTTKFIE
jgi:hypothetical protein